MYLYHLVCWLLDISVVPWPHPCRARAARGAATLEADASAAVSAVLSALSRAPPPLTSFGGMAPHRLRGARGATCARCSMRSPTSRYRRAASGTPQHRAAVAAAEEGTTRRSRTTARRSRRARRRPRRGGGVRRAAAAAAARTSRTTSLRGGERRRGGGRGARRRLLSRGRRCRRDRQWRRLPRGADDRAAARAARRRCWRRPARLLPLMGAPGVDAEAWGAECARLAPQLLLKVTWDQLGWRHRVVWPPARAVVRRARRAWGPRWRPSSHSPSAGSGTSRPCTPSTRNSRRS